LFLVRIVLSIAAIVSSLNALLVVYEKRRAVMGAVTTTVVIVGAVAGVAEIAMTAMNDANAGKFVSS
jgi:hypothetical protein